MTSVQDILDLVSDHISANTGQVNQERQIRQITQAVKYFKRKINLPSDDGLYSFLFGDDQFFYPVPIDYEEEGDIIYDNPDYNISVREWEFQEYSLLLKRTGAHPIKNQWSTTTINGSNQLMLVGSNVRSGSLIESFDTVGNWVASGDASGLAQDLLQKKYGDASLSFDIVNSTGFATLTNASESLDVQSLFENHAYFKLWTWMSDANIDNVILRLFVDNSNYWTITEDNLDDGSPFSADAWKKIGFPLDNAVKTGSPGISSKVTKIQISFDLGVGFTSAIDFRVDQLFTSIPDEMNLIYKTAYVGATETEESITKFTLPTDTVRICDYSSVFDDLIARRAALSLFPGLRGDINFYQVYQSEMKDVVRDWGLRFPKKRNSRFLPTKLRR